MALHLNKENIPELNEGGSMWGKRGSLISEFEIMKQHYIHSIMPLLNRFRYKNR